ncbi:hypothetical protein BOX15_Mlig019950g3, partial [Macrostomum lignano]
GGGRGESGPVRSGPVRSGPIKQRAFKVPLSIGRKAGAVLLLKPHRANQYDCFRYSILASIFHPCVQDAKRKDSYVQWMREFNFGRQANGPARHSSRSYKKFCRRNPRVSLRVFVWDHDTKTSTLFYSHRSKYDGDRYFASCLFVPRYDDFEFGHYLPIRNLNRLLSKRGKQRRYCPECTASFPCSTSWDYILKEHCCEGGNVSSSSASNIEWSSDFVPQIREIRHRPQEVMPKPEDAILKFKSHEAKLPSLYVLYADMECLCAPANNEANVKKTCNSKPLEVHVPICLAYRLITCQGLQLTPKLAAAVGMGDKKPCGVIYSQKDGENCVRLFLRKLQTIASEICLHAQTETFTPLLREYLNIKSNKKLQQTCQLCKRVFDKTEKTVLDHCHLTGLPRGIVCVSCNRKLSLKRYRLIVYFHNLAAYDGKFLVREIYNVFSGNSVQLSVLPETRERFKTFSLKFTLPSNQHKNGFVRFEICFKDTFAYLSTSLATLADRLLPEQLVHTKELLKTYPKLELATLRQKGIYPYSFLDCEEKLDNVTQLPPKENFFNKLTMSHCTEEDYGRACVAWNQFECQNLRDYTTAYLLLDVLLLCDVFENFRQTALREYGLDPTHFLGAPMFSMVACLLRVDEPIKLFTDASMYAEVESSIRGGFSFGTRHVTTANNPSVAEYRSEFDRLDPDFESLRKNAPYGTYLAYLDANSLYSSCMIQPLPVGDFLWLSRDEIGNIPTDSASADYLESPSVKSQLLDWLDKFCNDEQGAMFTVDLYYPRFLHDSTADLPLAIGHELVGEDRLSEQMKLDWFCLQRELNPDRFENATSYGDVKAFSSSTRKLIGSVLHKKKYVVHHRALRLYLELGMRVTRVYRVIRFTERPILRYYIEHNIERRKVAKTEFERDFFKLLNNALFGKFLQRVRDRLNFRMCSEAEKLEKYVSREDFLDVVIYNESLAGVSLAPRRVALDKPIIIGAAILDIAKTLVYDFYYNHVQIHHSLASARVLAGDTDSLMLALVMRKPDETPYDTLFKDLAEEGLLDTSNYSPSHALYSTKHKGRLLAWKDEFKGCIPLELVFLRPKITPSCMPMEL